MKRPKSAKKKMKNIKTIPEYHGIIFNGHNIEDIKCLHQMIEDKGYKVTIPLSVRLDKFKNGQIILLNNSFCFINNKWNCVRKNTAIHDKIINFSIEDWKLKLNSDKVVWRNDTYLDTQIKSL